VHQRVAAIVYHPLKNIHLAPLMYLDTPAKYTVPLALRMFNDSTSASKWGATLAMSTLSLVPVFVLFVFFQKYLIEGIATSGLEG
jgi:multiple sugar transport system permease protein